jgi:predicted transcriptional regulator
MTEQRDYSLESKGLVSEIVAAYVSNHTMEPSELPEFIKLVHKSLHNIGVRKSSLGAPGIPAVPIDESINPDYIVCLEDGRRLKMLKRHLKTAYGMAPEQYKERWGLSPDYPMVAPNYAKKRTEIAKGIGLGLKTRQKKIAA